MARQSQPGPEPEVVRAFREAAGLTQAEAAAMVYSQPKTWSQWEMPTDRQHHRRMPMAYFELWCIKVASKPAQNG